MAGALDIKRETIRIRREQAKRNAEAVAEAEKRRSEMKEGRPSERRRLAHVDKPSGVTMHREGHRLVYDEAPSLEEVAFASDVARKLAQEAHMDASVFDEYEASGATGFTKSDVESILEDLAELDDEEEEDLEEEEEDLDEDEEWEDEDDLDEEKQDDSEYEDKMDRSGDDK